MILLKNLFEKILLKEVNKFNNRNIFCLYLLFLLFIITISIIFYKNFIYLYPEIIDSESNIVYKNIPFEYGKLIENLIINKKYSSTISVLNNDIEFYLNRMPIVPFIFFLTNLVSSKLYFLIIAKNAIFFSILFFTILEFSKQKNYKLFSFLILNLIFFYNFYNLKIILNFVYADFITALFVPILFLISISNFKLKFYYIGLIILVLYLSKANMFPICAMLSIYFLVFEKKKIPVVFTLIAIIGWGFFGYIKTNKFPFGPSILSTSSHALSLSFNKNFHKFYPLTSVDYIESCDLTNMGKIKLCKNVPNKIYSEWDYYNYYKKQNKNYFIENKKIISQDIILKVKTIFFNFYVDGQIYQKNKSPKKEIDFFILLNKLIFIISIVIAIKSIFKEKFVLDKIRVEIIFLVIFFSSLPSYLLGWALNRHLVYLFLISKIYLFLKYNLKLK